MIGKGSAFIQLCRACGLFLCIVIVGCASPIKRAEEYAVRDDWLKAVIEYRKAYSRDPGNVEYKSRLKQTELKAADYYYQRGLQHATRGNLDAAIIEYQRGLTAMPEHAKLLQAMNAAMAQKEAHQLFAEGLRLREAGKLDEAKRLFEKAKQTYPEHEGATQALAQIEEEQKEKLGLGKLALSSTAPITLNFRQTSLRTAFEFIAKSFGVNVIFDDGVKDAPVTLFAKDVTFDQALHLMFATTQTFYKKIGANTILISPDTKAKRGQYEDYLIRTFQLTTIPAKAMNDILKGILTLNKVIINDHTNTLIVRDTEETLQLVEKLIKASDRKQAEMILDVEILEINRQKAENLGLNFGDYKVGVGLPGGGVPLAGDTTQAIKDSAILTLPFLIFRFYKQDVDAKTLANPKIRVISGKQAKIHIGDRVPLRGAVISDATGTRTSYEYKEVGIRLQVEPTVNLDNSVTVKLDLEVSSLGENLGTPEEPAFRIGTRNANSYMLLRDGETAILGGLIRDEERKSRVTIPGLGDIPIVGSIFTSREDTSGRSDVLLTITPRVVRSWDIPEEDVRRFYSGTVDRYSNRPLFAALETSGVKPQVSMGESDISVAALSGQAPEAPRVAMPGVAAQPAATGGPVFAFSEPFYQINTGDEAEIQLVGENLQGVTSVPIEVLFNSQLLEFVSGEQGDVAADRFKLKMDKDKGLLRVNLEFGKDGVTSKDKAVLARVRVRGLKPGISYLVYRTPTVKGSAGDKLDAQIRASRIVIR